ncbi:hypothetical protein Hanom_Chr06g00482791 [Helianthus anomalus]
MLVSTPHTYFLHFSQWSEKLFKTQLATQTETKIQTKEIKEKQNGTDSPDFPFDLHPSSSKPSKTSHTDPPIATPSQ